ncbi:MAG: DUF4215 domain-containing protein [Myxococcales bacterium]|nr:DUF4215 domain-containing protein [Myxococcales bacterium]
MRTSLVFALLCSFTLVSGLATLGCGRSDEPVDLPDGDGDAGGDDDLGGDNHCGNKIADNGEQCDDGNATKGDGCEPDCTWSCMVDAKCDDGDPCSGVETCSDHVCKKGEPIADGAMCGDKKVCKAGVCGDVTCGDTFVSDPEECDDGNATPGDGCEPDCRFTCLAADPMRACVPVDPCAGAGTCDAQTHTCTPGTPLADKTPCGKNPDKFCVGGVCVSALCGNGMTEPGEDCDDGNKVPGDGCEDACRWSCANAVNDCKQSPPACQAWACSMAHTCSPVADALQDGKVCGNNLICKGGACIALGAVCGNGVKEPGEACDFGAGNGANTGCEKLCKLSCAKQPDSCTDGNPCNGLETCGDVTINGQVGAKCSPGVPAANGTACGAKAICLGGLCKPSACGDGFLDLAAAEQCDLGAGNGPGTGCEQTCKFSCQNPVTDCLKAAPACQLWSCDANHICAGIADAAKNGQTCGVNLVCKAGACVAPGAVCGNGVKDPGEACDFGNANGVGAGCEKTCIFSCTKAPDSCSDGNPCNGTETCGNVTVGNQVGQKCSAGVALANGTACGNGAICLAGACKASACGDGFIDKLTGEVCDFGVANGPNAGCEKNCKLSCTAMPNSCSDGNPCNGTESCGAVVVGGQSGAKCSPGVALVDGTVCGVGQICLVAVCKASACGDGFLDKGAAEQCDFGAGNGVATGCEKTCKFSCTILPNSCPDMNACNGTETCGAVVVGGKSGQKCSAGVAVPDGAACGAGNICLGATCKLSVCGDGYIDLAKEQCEPPSTMTCNATCQKIVVVCGNGIREGSEQCDDSNKVALDGCDPTCKFEQDHRVNWLKMQFGVDAYCTANALGQAMVSGIAQSQLQGSLDTNIQDGSVSILFAMLGLDDLSGTNDPVVSIGAVNGGPIRPMGSPAYDGTADLDWWYMADAMSIDANRSPTAKLNGVIAAKTLTAGPGNITLTLALGAGPAPLKVTNTRVTASIGAVSTPKVSAGLPPGHLAAEHLDPLLQSYATTGQPNANGAAKLCGNITAFSLSKVPLPASVVQLCTAYTVNNSILDLLVNGCTFIVQMVKSTQPDKEDPTIAPVGAGPPYALTSSPQRVVNACKDKNGAVVDLTMCLNDAAYSSFFKFTTDRVIIK